MALNPDKRFLVATILSILSLVGAVQASAVSAPSIKVVPMPDSQSTLIYFKTQNSTSRSQWTNTIDKFLEPYNNGNSQFNRVNCNYTYGSNRLEGNQVCDVPLDEFQPCTHEQQYGYYRATPCVFLKLDNILNWEPKLYNATDNLPGNMPDDLRAHVKSTSEAEANTVWVSCEGETPADKEFVGPVQYLPRRGFPAHYYPFTNKGGYVSPLVAVNFQRPQIGVVISISCRAWAKNLGGKGRGAAHFELLID